VVVPQAEDNGEGCGDDIQQRREEERLGPLHRPSGSTPVPLQTGHLTFVPCFMPGTSPEPLHCEHFLAKIWLLPLPVQDDGEYKER
jgi:hypothetical protein